MIPLVDAWASQPAMHELVAAFGGRLPQADPLPWLDVFSSEHWDFRAGRERNLADPAVLTARQEALVIDLAPELGLAGHETPSHSHYDAILMTGGMIRAGIVKPRHVAALLENGITADSVVFLGGFRPFAGDELPLADALGVKGDDEFAAMVAGMEFAFGPLGEPKVAGDDRWREVVWGSLSVLAAPSSDPVRRANSQDTFRFWAERTGARSALLVTTPIYVPYQGAAAVETLGLGYGIAVETVGTSAAANDLGEFTQRFLPEHHLQELRSAVRGMLSLRHACARDV
ncbi:MAG: hypothetical protein JWN80_1721 [Microbacteriaceae bacterium]|nr:hypothetical protein [Microbacteriaceae bacterium]